MTERVFIVGAGRAGRGLARALRASGVAVVGLHGRRAKAHDEDGATAGALPASLAEATAVLVAVQDAELAGAAAELAGAPLGKGVVVLQLSGSATDRVLDPVRVRGAAAGTFHPLVPLADPDRAGPLLRGGWVGVGGDRPATEAAVRLAHALGARTLPVPAGDEDRARYHAAAVFASNFPVALAATAERLFGGAGVPAEAARDAAWRLLDAAVQNLRGRAAAEALTGPVVRGDAETIGRHVAALSHEPVALRVYLALTELTQATAASPTARSAAVEAAVDAARAQLTGR